jgi:16S rRNA (guanine527-N7)-methyltransferase
LKRRGVSPEIIYLERISRMRDILFTTASSLGISLSEKALLLFETYQRELLTWNKKINLVSVKSALDIPIKHFLDSLTLVPFIQDTSSQVLDIGSGAGFPAIPLKIAVNSLKISLLESSRKKTSFLKHIIRTLHLTDIPVIHNRAEYLMEDEAYRGTFTVVTSRATLKLPQFLRMGAYFLAPKGILIAMKSKRAEEELREGATVSQNLGYHYIARHDITLPITGDFRTIIIYEKSF